jgi:C4-dicarboxylate transporter DctM subunit
MRIILNLLLFLILFSGTAYAQPQTLDNLMDEVETEIAEDSPKPAEPAEGQGVRTLDDLMDDVMGAEAPAEDDAPEVANVVLETEEETQSGPEAPDYDGWFWLGLIVLIVSLIGLGVPLYVLIGSVSAYLLFFGGVFTEFRLLTSIIEQTRALADQPVLLAIPFFVISGAIMTEGDIARRLIAFAQSVFGVFPGGLAISAVFASVFFAAISGSSPVTVIAIGSIMYPALIAAGYKDRFSTGLVTSAGSLGILIPPSIPMIIYAIADPTGLKDPVGYTVSSSGGGDSSVKDLFIAGLGPGFVIVLALALWAFRHGVQFKIPKGTFSIKEVGRAFVDGFWALMLPVIILGGIYSGIFTATQAAAVSVIYAAAVEFFIHKSIKLENVPRIFSESAILMGSLLIIMALALGFNLYLDRAKIPEIAVEYILSLDLSLIAFLLLVNVLLIIVGFFMDIISAILILVPLLAPIAFGLGIHPLHMAIIFIVNLEIGYLTPPIGLNLFVSSTLFKKSIGEVVRSTLPFVGLMAICLMLITYIPTISLGLVSLSKGGDFWVPWPDKTQVEPTKVDSTPEPTTAPTTPTGDVKTLDELMDGAEGGEGVKTLDELMDAVDDAPADAPDGKPEEAPRVKTLDELMDAVEE